MTRAFLLASVFAAAAALILVLWSLLTFELPAMPPSDAWRARAAAHAVVIGVLLVAGFVGAAAGLRALPTAWHLRAKAAVALGFVYAVLTFFVLPFAQRAGSIVVALVALVIAGAVVLVGGRAFASRH